jgi:hypothetical protein
MKKFFLAIILLSVYSVDAQVITKISQMPVLTDPTGAYIPVIKSGSNYRVLVDSIKGNLHLANIGSGYRFFLNGNIKTLTVAGNAILDSTVTGQIRVTVPSNLSAYSNDAGFLTSVPSFDAVLTVNNVASHNLTAYDFTSFDAFGAGKYMQISGTNQRLTFSGTAVVNLKSTNISGTTKNVELPNVSGNLTEGATNGATTVHANTTGVIDISTLIGATYNELVQWHLAGVVQTLTYASSMTLNCSNGYNVNITLTGNGTITSITNIPSDRAIIIHITQDATGGRTLTFPANTVFPLGYATGTTLNLTTTGGAMDKVSLTYNSTTSKYEVEMAKNYGNP